MTPKPSGPDMRFGEPPEVDLHGGGDAAEAVIDAVLLLAHRATWLGEQNKLVYDLNPDMGHDCPAMRIVITVTPLE